MNNSKIKAVMSEVAAEAAERDEMMHCWQVKTSLYLVTQVKQNHTV